MLAKDRSRTTHFSDVVTARSEQEFRDAIDNPDVIAATWDMNPHWVKPACTEFQKYLRSSRGQKALNEYEAEDAEHSIFLNEGALELVQPFELEAQEDPLEEVVADLFDDIGFSKRSPSAADDLVRHQMYLRSLLSGHGRDESDFQVNTGSTIALPHFHNDIGILFAIAGKGPVLIRSELAASWNYKLAATEVDGGELRQFEARNSGRLLAHDYLSTAGCTAVLLKGRRDRNKKWGTRSNIGAVHMSEIKQAPSGLFRRRVLDHSRFLTAHFIYDH